MLTTGTNIVYRYHIEGEFPLTYNKTYNICSVHKSGGLIFFNVVNDFGMYMWFESCHFMSLKDYRKEKLISLCSK